jgi:hypothetical protein
VENLALDKETTYTTVSAVDPLVLRHEGVSNGYDLVLPEVVDLRHFINFDGLSYLHVKHPRTFNKITLTITSAQLTVSDTFTVQYYNNSDPAGPQWEAVPGLVNNTLGQQYGSLGGLYNIPFGQLGTNTIEFDMPPGWSPKDGYYQIRMGDRDIDLTPFTLTAASVTMIDPVADGLQQIMAKAPDGWSLDPAGELATAVPVYMHFSDESVLAALVQLAEQTGEHFVLSPTGRRVWWLGTGQQDSGLRAMATASPDDSTMAITSLQRTSDSYDLCTRLYAYGGGYGLGRLTMEQAVPVGGSTYTLGPDGAYMQNDAAVALYGRIDRRQDFPEIVPIDVSPDQVMIASTALYRRVWETLKRRSALQYAYTLAVVPGRYSVWPGQMLSVIYHEWIGGYHAVDIDASLWVLEVRQEIGADGVRLAGLTVATVDRAPGNDYHTVARWMQSTQNERSVRLPESGLVSRGSGTPIAMAITNGQVTGVRRVTPVPDGWYRVSEIGTIKFVGGVATYMEPAL